MPLYEFQCVDCGDRDERVAKVDDCTAICANCGGLLLRLAEDLFTPISQSPLLTLEEKDDAEQLSGI
jgi:putative FmdB family regulatory protein